MSENILGFAPESRKLFAANTSRAVRWGSRENPDANMNLFECGKTDI